MATSDKLEITLNGERRELFMSFGLLNLLTTLVDSPERVPTIPLEPETRTAVLAAVLAERKPSGKLIKDVDIDDIDISIEDAEKTLDFVMDHLIDFFIRALKKVLVTTEAHKDDLASLASSLNGSKA